MTISKEQSPVRSSMDIHQDEGTPHEKRGPQKWTYLLPDGCAKKLISKLFTNEDSLQFHKTFGILSLISFLYRYFYVYPTTGSLGFNNRWIDHLTILIHFLLSASSLIFHVISHRILNRPMIIWEEYRLHAIVFTTRSVCVYLFGLIRPFQGTALENILLAATVLVHHLAADYVTNVYGSKDGTTTVRIKDNQSKELSAVLRFYALYQFSALASHLIPSSNLTELGFNTFVAIQSSSFLMTLYRKGLITYIQHGFWYSFCLVVSLYHIMRHCGNSMFMMKLSFAFVLRTKLGLNKYIIWVAFSLLTIPFVEDALIKAVLASLPSEIATYLQ